MFVQLSATLFMLGVKGAEIEELDELLGRYI